MRNINLEPLKLTIILPIFNEENTLLKILNSIEKQDYIKKQIILVDDGSTDNSYEILKNYKFESEYKIIKHNKNNGKGSCIISAKEHIRGDIVLIQDADLEYNPDDYYQMLENLIKKNLKCLYGSRVLGKKRYSQKNFTSIFRIFANHMLTILSNIIYNQNLTDAHTCYKMIDSNLFSTIELKEKGFSFCPEVTSKISKKGVKIEECQIQYNGRSYEDGKKINFIDGIEALWVLLKYRFYD